MHVLVFVDGERLQQRPCRQIRVVARHGLAAHRQRGGADPVVLGAQQADTRVGGAVLGCRDGGIAIPGEELLPLFVRPAGPDVVREPHETLLALLVGVLHTEGAELLRRCPEEVRSVCFHRSTRGGCGGRREEIILGHRGNRFLIVWLQGICMHVMSLPDGPSPGRERQTAWRWQDSQCRSAKSELVRSGE
ncbi:hypothetical protein CUT44_05455 [Streptomyces carminius]|uniref:Uncharacterized protein n=1 Tax=Streptomyces carminius TaxID=2665496 RepID=A0A2M8M4S5_9ACTN|nr:hypothetical protein CUT44_05455 [Streptomyces carminius]